MQNSVVEYTTGFCAASPKHMVGGIPSHGHISLFDHIKSDGISMYSEEKRREKKRSWLIEVAKHFKGIRVLEIQRRRPLQLSAVVYSRRCVILARSRRKLWDAFCRISPDAVHTIT